MRGKYLTLTIISLGLSLTACSKLKMQHPNSSIYTHNICYELKQQILQNESRNTPDEIGNSPIERAKLYRQYRKYHCDETESGKATQTHQEAS